MLRFFELLLIGFFLIKRSFGESDEVVKPKIAIVGADMEGASTSQFLTELLDGDVEIDIFESNEKGGCSADFKLGANVYSSNAIVISSESKYMRQFVKLLGFEGRPYCPTAIDFGIWTGDEFLCRENLTNIFRELISHVKPILSKYANIYQIQADGKAYETSTDLISAMSPELVKLLKVSTAEYLQSSGFSNKLIDELVKGILNTNFGQTIAKVHSFAGLRSVADDDTGLLFGEGGSPDALTGDIYPRSACEVSRELVSRNCKVNEVRSQVKTIRYFVNTESLTQYELTYDNTDHKKVVKNIYDIVIIAAPLTADQKHSIQFVGFPENVIQFPGNYVTSVGTFVVGHIKPSYFGLEKSVDFIECSDPKKTKIDCIIRVHIKDETSSNSSKIWKVFSKEHLTSDQLNSLFSQVDRLQDMGSLSNPVFSTPAYLDKFVLYDSLYHVSAINWVSNDEEMGAIAAKNVALLIQKKLASCCRDSSAEEKRRCKYSCKELMPPAAWYKEL